MSTYRSLVYTDLVEEDQAVRLVGLDDGDEPEEPTEHVAIPCFVIEAEPHPLLGHVFRLPAGLQAFLAR